LCNSLLFLPSLNLFSNSHLKMDTTLEKLKKYFPALPQNAITKIYCARCARLRLLMNHGILKISVGWLKQRSDYQVSPPILSSHTCLEQVKALLQRNVMQNDWKSVIDVPDGLVMQHVVL
jgi:hypothetical protein